MHDEACRPPVKNENKPSGSHSKMKVLSVIPRKLFAFGTAEELTTISINYVVF